METSEKTCKTCENYTKIYEEERCKYPMSIIQACLYSEGRCYYKKNNDISNNESILPTTE